MTDKYIISLPRSGQHLTERFLKFYYEYTKKNIDFTYCEFYNCCNTTPCAKGYSIQKNHDFNLNLKINNQNKYLVLYRENIIDQLESYFRFQKHYESKSLSSNGKDLRIAGSTFEIIYSKEDKQQLLNFFKTKAPYYCAFIKKWVFNNNKNIYKISYEMILSNPKIMNNIINFFYQDNIDIIEDFQKIEKIEKKHNSRIIFNE